MKTIGAIIEEVGIKIRKTCDGMEDHLDEVIEEIASKIPYSYAQGNMLGKIVEGAFVHRNYLTNYMACLDRIESSSAKILYQAPPGHRCRPLHFTSHVIRHIQSPTKTDFPAEECDPGNLLADLPQE